MLPAVASNLSNSHTFTVEQGQNASHNDDEWNNHVPWVDPKKRGNCQLTVIAELEKIILNQRIDFRVKTRTDEDTENAAKQTI